MSFTESLESLLAAIVIECSDENTESIGLGGSYARGTATPLSDVDIAQFVYVLPDRDRKRYAYRDGRLVSYSIKSLDLEREALKRPERAIWLVPGFRDMQILSDEHGTLAAFIQEIQSFAWEPLQAAADAYASNALMLETEFAYKILAALLNGNDEALAYETMNLLMALTGIVAVQRGVLIQSNSTYFQQVQHSVSLDSSWTRYHRIAAGVDQAGASQRPLAARGLAILHLFLETRDLLRPILLKQHREVVEATAQAIRETLARQKGAGG
jgi:predicted nucleotidyltransferase